jgi:tryptophan synthase alpha chain
VLKLAADIRRRSQVGLIIFSYFNPILRMGIKRFCDTAEEAGVDGALVTDLPVEEAQPYLREMRMRRLSTVFLAAPTSTDQRLRDVVKASTGFVYAVSRTGVTGQREQVSDDARRLVARIRKFTKLPIAVGFGISTAEQFAAVGNFAEAAVIGSAIVQTIEKNPGREPEAVAEFVRMVVGRQSMVVGKPPLAIGR